jgi:hypothetical protein
MNCPDCGLSVPLRARFLTLDVCPRCLARRRVARPMTVSDTQFSDARFSDTGAQPRPIGAHGLEHPIAAHRREHPLGPDMPAAA